MKIYIQPDKEFKTVVLRKLSELQKNRDKQLNSSRKTMHKQKEKFNRETEVIKDNQMGILELKNTLYEKNMHQRASTLDLINQNKESVNLKRDNLKLSSQKEKKDLERMEKAYMTYMTSSNVIYTSQEVQKEKGGIQFILRNNG